MSLYIHNRAPNDRIRVGVYNGVDIVKSYINLKARFKATYFTNRGGVENEQDIREQPPQGMDPADWRRHVEFYVSEASVRLARVNTDNQALQVDIARQGRRSFAERRHEVVSYFLRS